MSGRTGIGAPVRRKEDRPHLTGTACFTADPHRPAETHAAVVRSPHAPDAPRLWDDVPGNVSFNWEHGDAEAVDTALAHAAHVARMTVANNRIAVAFMEPRAALAEFDPATGRWTLWAGCQSAHRIQ